MKNLLHNKNLRDQLLTYGFVIVAFAVLQLIAAGGGMSSSLKGMLVPICAYVVMAVSLNLTVGVLGELSLGHAGFMCVGAFMGVTAAISLQSAVPAPASGCSLPWSWARSSPPSSAFWWASRSSA